MTDVRTWRGRRAPELKHFYPAWSTDPTPAAAQPAKPATEAQS